MTSAGRPISVPIRNMNNLTFLSCNVRSLHNKLDELQHLATSNQAAIIFVQETWCLPCEPDSLYEIDGFLFFRRDRTERTGGGVGIYVHPDHFTSIERLPLLQNSTESLWLKLSLSSQSNLPPKHLLVCTSYRPPNSAVEPYAAALEASLGAAQSYNHPILLTGDLNSKCSAWCDSDQTDEAGDAIQQLFDMFDITQHVTFPTNIYGGSLKSCLDVVATANLPNLHLSSLAPVGHSDHITLKGTLRTDKPTHQPPSPSPRTTWCWSKVNVKQLQSAVASADWRAILDSNDVNSAWTMWKTQLMDIAHRNIPHRPTTPCGCPRARPWMTKGLADHIKHKHRLFRLYKRTHAPADWAKYQECRNRVSSHIRRAKSLFVAGLDRAAAGQTRAAPRLHQFLRCFTKSDTNNFIPDLHSDSETAATADRKAEVLNRFFTSQARLSLDDGPLPPIQIPAADDGDRLTEFTTTPQQVNKVLHSLDPSKAAGGDGIPTRLLRLVADQITPCVHHIFALSLSTATLPDEWKRANVTPIYKHRGKRSDPSNYRPISLLVVLSKALERIVHQALYAHLADFLPLHQSGFRPRDNCTYQLARIVHLLARGIDDGKRIATCYYDLTKAFDRVWHGGLLHKLHHLGVRNTALKWIGSYLSDRHQRVLVHGSPSSWAVVPAGVPQGSVLGPLLFLAYTVDLPAAVTDDGTHCAQYADDTALTTIKTNHAAVQLGLQESITATARWLTTWRLAANQAKTVLMQTTRCPLPAPLEITLNGSPLRVVKEHKHLGVTFSSDLRWTSHVNSITTKASRMLGILRRLRPHLTKAASSTVYKVYIRPILEYSSVAWSNLPAHLLNRLERFQRRAAKIVLRKPVFMPSDHDLLLDEVGWETLSSRRELHLAILGHAIATARAPQHILQASYPKRVLRHDLRQQPYFNTPIPNTTLYQESPIFQACTIFNKLPPSVQELQTTSDFKTAAQLELLSCLCSCTDHLRRT